MLKLCYRGEPIYWVILLAFIFDSYSALEAADKTFEAVPKTQKAGKDSTIYTPTLYRAFIASGGSFSATSQKLELPEQAVAERLRAKGLVSLDSGSNKSDQGRAMFAFLVEHRGISESANIGGLSEESFLDLLRGAGAPMSRALQLMHAKECATLTQGLSSEASVTS